MADGQEVVSKEGSWTEENIKLLPCALNSHRDSPSDLETVRGLCTWASRRLSRMKWAAMGGLQRLGLMTLRGPGSKHLKTTIRYGRGGCDRPSDSSQRRSRRARVLSGIPTRHRTSTTCAARDETADVVEQRRRALCEPGLAALSAAHSKARSPFGALCQ